MIQIQPHHLSILFDPLAVRSQFFSQLEIGDTVNVFEQLLDRSELPDQVRGGLLADSFDSRYIVDTIPSQSENFADTFRAYPPFPGHLLDSEKSVRILWSFEIGLVGGINLNRVVHQLKKVLIVRRENRLNPLTFSGDHVTTH